VPDPFAMDERSLLHRVASGDEAAFAELFNAYKGRVYSIGMRLMGTSVAAEEIVQDVFLKIWLKRETLISVEHFRAYLFTATRHEIINALRRIARRRGIAGEALRESEPGASDTDALLLDKEYQEILRQAIERLPAQQREVYRLIKEQGLKREVVAEQLRLSPETVKVHLAKAMRSIRAFCISHLDLYIVLVLFDSFIK